MADPDSTAPGGAARGGAEDRLDSWKRIAAYLKRDVSTVQRWERREGMPVHRHLHDKLGSVFAYRSELDRWWESRRGGLAAEASGAAPVAPTSPHAEETARTAPARAGRRWAVPAVLATCAAAAVAGGWFAVATDRSWSDPFADMKYIEVAAVGTATRDATISRDGTLVAFLADRDGRTDVWAGEFAGTDYRNLTRGIDDGLVNSAIRPLTFFPDSPTLAIWSRSGEGDIRMLAAPLDGGTPSMFLRAAEVDWSPDGKRLVYHPAAAGDPLVVSETGADGKTTDRVIYAAPPGIHCHFPVWSPDGGYIYFTRGVPNEYWDIWRIRPSGEGLERITTHGTLVSHPVPLDGDWLMYLATDADGSGPWVYAMHVPRRGAYRISSGLESYSSLAASGDGRRFAATVARRRTRLSRIQLVDDGTGPRGAEPTPFFGDGERPRIGPGFVVFTAARGDRRGVWSLENGAARELWSRAGVRIVGAPAIAPDGRRIAFTVDAGGKTALYVFDRDGGNAQLVTDTLALRGSPAWWPDGRSILAAVETDGVPRLTRIRLNGDPPTRLVSEYSLDAVWSPGGDYFVYTGADVGTEFPLRAARADGRPHPVHGLNLTRGARRVAFLNDRPTLIYLDGEVEHKDLWASDLQTGTERRLTNLPPDFIVADFDVSPDGTEIIVDRIETDSTLRLMERQ